jgi:uncharacterized protein YbgA (DUF1722 family)/uncharacterized protein YbbK (DUF523 family)
MLRCSDIQTGIHRGDMASRSSTRAVTPLWADTLAAPIRVGVSSCLLGERVRWDGDENRDAYIVETLGRVFDLVPICPEVGIGLGVPRPPIHLVQRPDGLHAIGVDDPGLDVTSRLSTYARENIAEHPDVCGYIFKSGSPSCGIERVKVHTTPGAPPERIGVGIYAATWMAARPELPVEDEGRLADAELRDNFIERVFTLARWQALQRLGVTRGRLVAFHTAHKLSVMAHGAAPYRDLGRLVARMDEQPTAQIAARYGAELMAALRRPATRKLHANVLTHLAGYLKRDLDRGDKAELVQAIADYRLGHVQHVQRVVPMTLLRHHFRRHPDPYVAAQLYLFPSPAEQSLRQMI